MYIYTPILVGLVFSNQGLATLLGLIDANVMLPHQHVNGVGNILVAIALSSFVLLLPWKQVVLQTKDDVGTAAQRPALVHFLVGDCKAHAEGQYTEPEPRERLFQPELNLGLGGRGGGVGFFFDSHFTAIQNSVWGLFLHGGKSFKCSMARHSLEELCPGPCRDHCPWGIDCHHFSKHLLLHVPFPRLPGLDSPGFRSLQERFQHPVILQVNLESVC